ncbi:MAG: complex I subunit 1 family protein [Bryobacterales bacterium]|nr:NADH-quinone oxidoreductase subunit H [Bryobacteraceae bacterium]MDW8130925.1 complex I subunit 1 family protein [Bryobacterales bacterium]
MQAILEHPLTLPLALAALVVALFPLVAGYVVLLERKILADFQVRLGPMRVGPHGLLQPIADAVKLIIKEDIVPAAADRPLFLAAPIITTVTALTSFAVLPFSEQLRVADVNVGLLVVSAMSAVGVLGIVLGGWSANSHYALLGALRSGAQLISYEVALAFALLSGVMTAGTLSMVGIVKAQYERQIWFAFENYGLMLIPAAVYLIAAVAETNRAPFDLPEAESELVAGFHTEYSGFRWALYFLAEYANIFVVAGVMVTLFWGGWLRPFPNVAWLEYPLNYGFPFALMAGSGALCFRLARRLKSRANATGLRAVGLALIGLGLLMLAPPVNRGAIGPFWFLLKVFLVIYAFIWFRGTWPRFRYDQLMDIGWKRLIPIGMGALLVNGVVGMLRG